MKDGCGDEGSGVGVHDSGCKVCQNVEYVKGVLVGENTEPSPLSTHLTHGCMSWLCVVCMYRVYALVQKEQPALVEGEQGQIWWVESEDRQGEDSGWTQGVHKDGWHVMSILSLVDGCVECKGGLVGLGNGMAEYMQPM